MCQRNYVVLGLPWSTKYKRTSHCHFS